MVKDKSKQAVQQGQIHLLVYLRELCLHEHHTLALARLPDIVEVVDALTPFVYKQRRWFSVRRLDPRREETALVSLKEQELVKVGVCDLLDRLNVVARDKLVIRVEELNAGLLERALREQQTLDAGQALVRVVIGLLDECELFTL